MSIRSIALDNAYSVSSGFKFLSNLIEASVERFSLFEVFLIKLGLKFADSKKILVVLSSISEFDPPIIPANPIEFFSSAITILFSGSSLFSPSSVVIFSLLFDFLTYILFPYIFDKSNACRGCPISNITKLVISTILFIGLSPIDKSLDFNQSGDSDILTESMITPEYLEHICLSKILTIPLELSIL